MITNPCCDLIKTMSVKEPLVFSHNTTNRMHDSWDILWYPGTSLLVNTTQEWWILAATQPLTSIVGTPHLWLCLLPVYYLESLIISSRMINFLQNVYYRHPIAHPWEWDMRCLLWFQTGVYTKFSGRLSEEPFPWLIQKFPCIFIFKIGQPGCQLNLSAGQIRLDLTSGRPLV